MISFSSKAKAEGFAADMVRLGERAELVLVDEVWNVDCDPEDTTAVDNAERAVS
jgi:hypothetical protein